MQTSGTCPQLNTPVAKSKGAKSGGGKGKGGGKRC